MKQKIIDLPDKLMECLDLPGIVRWKAIYANLYRSTKFKNKKQELLKKVHKLIKKKAKRRWTLIKDINPPSCILDVEKPKFEKVSKYKDFLKNDGIAKAIQKIL